ncbi:MAG: tetratricopeptide repeat protein [Chloroflexota bacterium]
MMENWEFKDEIQVKKIDLARATLQMARTIAYPHLDVSLYHQKIDLLAAEINKQISPDYSLNVKAELLMEFLFQNQRFKGNVEQYYDVRNSFVNDLLDRRLGIPISLSTLCIIVAHRLNMKAYGVGLPGHFIVMVPNGNQRLFFDPFNGGGRLSLEDCARLVERTTGFTGAFQPDWLDPVSEKQILVRMLTNLRAAYVQTERWPEAISTVECLHVLNPDDATIIRDLGVLNYQRGKMNQAVEYLNRYAQKDPKATDLPFIKNGIAQKLDDWVKLN